MSRGMTASMPAEPRILVPAESRILVSINVHEKPDFVRSQVENIRRFLKCEHKVILNVNESMQSELKGTELEQLCNPQVINKRRYHGSLLKGICANVEYAIKSGVDFDYVLVLSSRTFFKAPVTIDFLQDQFNKSPVLACELPRWGGKSITDYVCDDDQRGKWHWHLYFESSVSKSYPKLAGGPHEGLFFPREASIHFSTITDDVFDFEAAMEEFVIQTICRSENIPFLQLSENYEFGVVEQQFPLHKIIR